MGAAIVFGWRGFSDVRSRKLCCLRRGCSLVEMIKARINMIRRCWICIIYLRKTPKVCKQLLSVFLYGRQWVFWLFVGPGGLPKITEAPLYYLKWSRIFLRNLTELDYTMSSKGLQNIYSSTTRVKYVPNWYTSRDLLFFVSTICCLVLLEDNADKWEYDIEYFWTTKCGCVFENFIYKGPKLK